MADRNPRLGVILMVLTTMVFSIQDAISRQVGATLDPLLVVMIRFWFFGAVVVAMAARGPGLRAVVRTKHPVLQIIRGALLALEIAVMIRSFVLLGLVETHAAFACYPLIITALSGPILGERVGWRRWAAIGAGFVGVLIILKPTNGVFSPLSAIPLLAASLFAIYGLMTRYVSREDSAQTSFFYTGVAGCVTATIFGIGHWQPINMAEAGWLLALCISGMGGHFLLIRTYEVSEASAVQPFAYLQLPFASLLGLILFHETLRVNVVIGAAIIVGAGVFTLWRERQRGA